MKSIPIPMATIQAYGATPVRIDLPKNFELDNGQQKESMAGMKVGETVYVLIGIEENEREALARTNCFYLGFISGFIPVFTTRVADIIHGETDDPQQPLPIIFANYDLSQEARTSWEELNPNVVFKKIEVKSELRWEDGPENQIIEAGDYLFHDFRTGLIMVVNHIFAEMIKSSEEGVLEIEEVDTPELQQPDGNGEHQEKGVPEL